MNKINKVIFSGSFDSIAKSNNNETERLIKGYMSVPKVDFENEIIDPKAYDDAIDEVRRRHEQGRPIPMFIEHRRKELSLPIGKIIDAGKDEKGLWFKAAIANGSIGDPVWALIKQGILYGCSMGGDALRKHTKFDHKINKDVNVIDKMLFRELSLTGLPVNDEAVFSIAKSLLGKEEKSKQKINSKVKEVKKSLKILDKELEKAINTEDKIKKFEKAVESADDLNEEQIQRIKDAMSELGNLLGINENQEKKGEEEDKEEENIPKENEEKVEIKEETEDFKHEEVENFEDISSLSDKKVDNSINEKLDKIIELLELKTNKSENEEIKEDINDIKNEGGEKDVNLIKCSDCGAQFEKADYDVNFCPRCGYDFNAEAEEDYNTAIDQKTPPTDDIREPAEYEYEDGGEEEIEEIEEEIEEEPEDFIKAEDILSCGGCGSQFAKADYEMSFCPTCGGELNTINKAQGKGDSVAVAGSPKGTDTKWGKNPKAKKPTVGDTVAVADSPEGAKTKWTSKAKRASTLEKNIDVENPPKSDGNKISHYKYSVKENDKFKTLDNEDASSLHDWDNKFQQFKGASDESKFKTYKTKSMEKSIDANDIKKIVGETIEKALEERSAGRKAIVPNESKVEKSQTETTDVNRYLARVFLGKEKSR